jgi:predicted RNase H-like HicB family nuclease
MTATMAPVEYLRRPYGRMVVPESDGTFRAEIMEFPGCLATGETAAEALANLEATAMGWLEATIARGQHVPDPIDGATHSGKLVVRLGRDLHRRSAHMAAAEGVSLNQFIVSGVAERVGSFARSTMIYAHSASVQAGLTIRIGFPQRTLLSASHAGRSVNVDPSNATLVVPRWEAKANA